MDPEEMGGDDWTPSMQQDYEKAKAAKGELVEAYKRGDINAQDHATLNARVGEDLGQLGAMKQAAVQKATQSRRQQEAEDNAFRTSIEERNRAHIASNAPDHVALLANPADPTQHGLFSVDHKGDLQRLDFGDKNSDMSQFGDRMSQSEDGAVPYHPLSELAAQQALGATPAADQTAAPSAAPADHTMTINVGGEQNQARFSQGAGGWQQTGQQRFNNQTGQWEDMAVGSAMGTTPQPMAPVNTPHGAISQGQLLGFVANAQAAARSAGLRPGTPGFDHFVAAVSQDLMKAHQSQSEREWMRSERERSTNEEDRRKEKARAEAAATATAEKKAKAEEDLKLKVTNQLDKSTHDILSSYRTERHHWDTRIDKALTDEEKNTLRSQMPEHLKDEEAMTKRARAAAQSHVEFLHPEAFQRTDAGKKAAAEGAKKEAGGGGKGGATSPVDFPGGFTQHQQDRVEQAPPAAQQAPPAPAAPTGTRNALGQVVTQQSPPLVGYARGTATNIAAHARRAWARLTGALSHRPKEEVGTQQPTE